MIDLRTVPARRLAHELIARAVRYKWRDIIRPQSQVKTAGRGDYQAFGEEILKLFRTFSESRGWRESADDLATIVAGIRSGENQEAMFFYRLLNILLPDFERDLYRYYSLQQYHSLYRFLQYPFLGSLLDSYVTPYYEAVKRIGPLRVLEYGPGIPYGLVYVLRERPERVSHVTLVELDLVYLDFAEYLVRHYGGHNMELTIHRMRTIDEMPVLKPEHNMVFAKDVFEHLKEPEKVVSCILAAVGQHAISFFDFRDHGKKAGQHVTPNVTYLKQLVEQQGFLYEGEIQQLEMFTRNTLKNDPTTRR